MCGIAGFILPQKMPLETAENFLNKANEAQKFRGPDGQGYWTDGQVGLAHVHLAILPESDAGPQPQRDPWGQYIVYNGELYDYQTLLNQFSGFSSSTCRPEGTVIGGLLETKGPDAFQGIRGMFAIARYNPIQGSLLLMRDAYGQKPLYVTRWQDGWAFASTIASLHAFMGKLTIREEAMYEYLVYRSVGGFSSAWQSIEQVPPGGWIALTLDGEMKTGQWYHYPQASLEIASPQEVHINIMHAVKTHIPKNMPAKCFLSGGLDSAIVAYACSTTQYANNIKTLSVGYDQNGYEDESEAAKTLATQFGLPFNRCLLDYTQLPELLLSTAQALEDPIQDPVCVATLLLARYARKEVKVVLTGDGSDEGWGGYMRYDNLPETFNDYLKRLWVFSPEELGVKCAPSSYLENIKLCHSSAPLINQIIQFEVACRFRNYHLARVDKISMSVGLETRCPFLDPMAMHFAMGLADHSRRPNGRPKGLLVDAFAPFLPEWLIHRKKQPFTLPIKSWLQNNLKEFTYDLLLSSSSFVNHYFPVKNLLLLHEKSESTHVLDKNSLTYEPASIEHKIWSLLMLECWFQTTKRWR
jgi:asparagine synthase (glutamine-hydrolysing)